LVGRKFSFSVIAALHLKLRIKEQDRPELVESKMVPRLLFTNLFPATTPNTFSTLFAIFHHLSLSGTKEFSPTVVEARLFPASAKAEPMNPGKHR
jgi:hypothetical protein